MTIGTDFQSFIQSTETTIVQDAEAAYAWLKAELAKLEPTVAADLKAAVQEAVKDVLENGDGLTVTVADVLDVLARDGEEILAQVKSDVVSAVVGLTTASA